MRMMFDKKEYAEAFALSVHKSMCEQDYHYALGDSLGRIKRWAIPYQDLDEQGLPVSGWWVNLKERVMKVVKQEDVSRIKPYYKAPNLTDSGLKSVE